MFKQIIQWLTGKKPVEVKKATIVAVDRSAEREALKRHFAHIKSQEAASVSKPYTAPVIFLHLAQIYRDQCKGKVAKRYHRRGLRLALEKITTGKNEINDALYPPPVSRARR